MTIKSRKHAQPLCIPAALAALMIPAMAHAGANAAPDADAPPAARVTVVGTTPQDFKADHAASPKYTEALVNTPQTITVIKRELIEQQGAVTLTEALRSTPGVGTFFLGENGNTNTGDAIYMRGFDTSASIYVDGVRDLGSVSRDVFNIEQIDVLKGPAGTDNGSGAPTGSINLSSKRANLEQGGSASLAGGSGSHKRATVDYNHVLDAANGSALRINAMVQDSGNPGRDVVRNKRHAVAPALAFGLNGPTRFFLNTLHVRQDNLPDGGVPTIGLPGYGSPDPKRPFIANGPMVDPQGFYGSVRDYDKVDADMATARFEHDFSPSLKLINTSRYGKTRQDYLLTSFTANTANLGTPDPADPSTWTLARTLRTVKDQSNRILANQTVMTAQFGSGFVTHTVVGGLEFLSEEQRTFGYSGAGTLVPVKLYAPDPALPVTGLNLVRNGVFGAADVDTQSAYVFDTMKVGSNWQFSGGVRADRYEVDYRGAALSTATSHPSLPVGTLVQSAMQVKDTLVNGKLAALYKPTANSSVYAMVASSKQPPGANLAVSTSANNAGNLRYEPQETGTAEIGGKIDLLSSKLALTAALYRTSVRNEVEQDPVDLLYYQTGRKRVQGIELGVTGQIARGWLASVGYTHMDTEVTAGKMVTAAGANALSYTPKNAFTAWTSYSTPWGVKLGGGARYIGKSLRGTDGAVGTPAFADAYWVFDAMASYAITPNLDLQLNVYNLADERYVAAINKSGYRYTPGTPRSATLTANFRF